MGLVAWFFLAFPGVGRACCTGGLQALPARRDTSGRPGQRPAPPRPRTSGDMLGQFMAGMTAGWAAGTAPPACRRRAEQPGAGRWRPGLVLPARPAHGPGADALARQDPLGHGDLLGRGGQVRRGSVPAAAVAEPGLLSELQPAVKAIAGAGGPVPAGLARRDGRPVHPAQDAGAGLRPAQARPEPPSRRLRRRGRPCRSGGGQGGAGKPRRHLV